MGMGCETHENNSENTKDTGLDFASIVGLVLSH